MSKKTFVVSELFYPNKTSTAYIMTEIARSLAKSQNVNVICADIQYDDNFDSSASDDVLRNINVFQTTKPKGNKDSIVGKLINAVQTSFSFGWNIIKRVNKGDTVLAVTNPFLLVLILGILRIFKDFKYALLVHDVFPENAVPAGLVRKTSLSYKLSKKIYDWAYSKADKLIVIGRDMAELVGTKTGFSNKIHVIENWFDNDLCSNEVFNRNAYVGENLDGKIVLGFAGNMGRVQNVPEFLTLFSKVNNPLLHLIIIGEGTSKDKVTEIINTQKLTNVTYLGAKPRSEQSQFLNCCDIGLVTLAKGMRGLGVPSKSYNLLALGKPILFIGDKESEIDLVIKESTVGWTFDWTEESKLVQFLDNLKDVPFSVCDRASKLANERYADHIILSKIEHVLI